MLAIAVERRPWQLFAHSVTHGHWVFVGNSRSRCMNIWLSVNRPVGKSIYTFVQQNGPTMYIGLWRKPLRIPYRAEQTYLYIR